ncbi:MULTISPECIES: pilus assembly protein PilP [unclassified Neisseria]|uniref:pilus assembly protein PilP n=1 Tax=unclassified Neisseria TaxID=2623750 RepID=UPI002665251A|nr:MULTISPECIES: pilus assembly protein PilP [unclassified Neisseria]MDO1509909.1 pilus assembly protein PilP [Neisseria sp. MVDL19-042950]MDO1516108.1 pilus assembly protein PilP [Neisseria sp. MVDL18-041461]MDO1563223.1 pilus assembly protein PilP [Neisseria sp. MVDL20-010259]
MKNKILLAGILALAACTPAHEDLKTWTQETQQQAKAKIIPFEEPIINPPKPYTPPTHSGLDAFDNKRLNTAQQSANAPNMNRPKEVLEGFSLENLKYVGMFKKDNQTSGYVEANGHVYTVHVGNYIGQNFGHIQSIVPDKILLTEVVEDSYGNWTYRKTELPLSSGSEKSTATVQNNK